FLIIRFVTMTLVDKDVTVTKGENVRLYTKNREMLHKILPGVVLHQFVTCGRPNCRCANGHLHGPYWYRFYRVNGRLRKEYVKPAELERVRAGCNARRQENRLRRVAFAVLREFLSNVREVEQR